MQTRYYLIIIFIVLVVLVWVLWRLYSRRQSLPCPSWLRWMVELDNPFTEANRAHVIVSYLDLQPGMKVLDAGCGPGRLTIPLAQNVGRQGSVVAIDLQEGMLQRAKEKAQSANLQNIQFIQAGLGEGRLGKNQFERALLVTVLGEIPQQVRALSEIYQALKPGGILSITEIIFDPHFQSRSAVLKAAGEAGFREKNFFGKRLAYTMHLEKPVDSLSV